MKNQWFSTIVYHGHLGNDTRYALHSNFITDDLDLGLIYIATQPLKNPQNVNIGERKTQYKF